MIFILNNKIVNFSIILVILLIFSIPQAFAEDLDGSNKLSTYNNDNIYITEVSPSVMNYTSETHTVNISTSYPRELDTDDYYSYIGSFNVYVDTIDSDGLVVTDYTYNIHNLTYDLDSISDKLTGGVYTLYFGPSPFALSLESIAYEYSPLTVVVNNGDKLSTLIRFNQTSLALGDKITGILTDGYNGLKDKVISFKTPLNTTSTVTTNNKGEFSILAENIGEYSSFKFAGDTEYNSYTSPLIVNVTQGKYQIIFDEGIVKYVSGKSCLVSGTINYPSSSIIWDSLWVWFNNVVGSATPARDTNDGMISLSSKTFTIDLNNLYTMPSSNFVLTAGPQYGSSNQVIIHNNLSLDLASIRVILDDTKVDTVLTLYNSTVRQGEYITGSLSDEYTTLKGRVISYTTPSGKTETVTTNKNGLFNIQTKEMGEYTNFIFTGDDVHNQIISNQIVTVTKARDNFTITLNPKNISYTLGESLSITGNLSYPSSLSWDMDLYYWLNNNISDSKKLTFTKTGGNSFSFNLKDLNIQETGTYTLTVGPLNGESNNFIKNNDLSCQLDTINIKVTSKNTTSIIISSNTSLFIGENITGRLTSDNIGLKNKTIMYTAPNNTISTVTTDDNGYFNIPVQEPGEYKNFQFAGDENLTSANSNTIILVTSNQTELNITIIESVINTSNGQILIHLEANDKSNINEGTIELIINNNSTGKVNIKDSQASLNINYTPGVYNALIKYTGDKLYNNITKNITLIINNNTSDNNSTGNLTTSISLNYKQNNNTPLLYGFISDENNNLLNLNLTLMVKNLNTNQERNYTIQSVNGEFKENLNLNYGQYSAKVIFNGKDNLLASTSNTKVFQLSNDNFNTIITDNSILSGVYSNFPDFKGKITDDDGNILVGYHMALNITRLSSGASKTYYVTTDYNGEYTLPINLAPGYYTIKTSINDNNYTGSSFSSIIINQDDNTFLDDNLTFLSVDSFNYPYLSGNNLTGRLLNTWGAGLPGQHITVKLTRTSSGASKTYDVITDFTGVYNLVINLARGQYTAQCSYAGLNNYKDSNTSTTLTIY